MYAFPIGTVECPQPIATIDQLHMVILRDELIAEGNSQFVVELPNSFPIKTVEEFLPGSESWRLESQLLIISSDGRQVGLIPDATNSLIRVCF